MTPPGSSRTRNLANMITPSTLNREFPEAKAEGWAK
jgi:hypothetical protein